MKQLLTVLFCTLTIISFAKPTEQNRTVDLKKNTTTLQAFSYHLTKTPKDSFNFDTNRCTQTSHFYSTCPDGSVIDIGYFTIAYDCATGGQVTTSWNASGETCPFGNP